MNTSAGKISSATVRDDFNDPNTVIHYSRAAHFLGLWKSESILIRRFFPDRDAALLEAGCGAGRVTVGLHDIGYRNITAFDFAEELVDQARSLVDERAPGANIRIHHADATRLREADGFRDAMGGADRTDRTNRTDGTNRTDRTDRMGGVKGGGGVAGANGGGFDGVLFMFNGLMQIPGRENRLAALRELRAVCRDGAPLLFTTHDRENCTAAERILWRVEADRWAEGRQDPRLVEFGDRYFEDETGRTFMHLPTRAEILADLAVTGWRHVFDSLRSKVSPELRAVREFSDECRFWSAVAV